MFIDKTLLIKILFLLFASQFLDLLINSYSIRKYAIISELTINDNA
jgi:hypothetical protein